MKPPNDDLFQLIRALTPSERRYFRKYAARHTLGDGNQYLLLFDAILKQEQYDEEVIKAELADIKIGAYLPVAKRYLYEQIGAALHLFHTAESPEAQLKKQLHVIDILLQKGLIGQAGKLIAKAKQQADHFQFVHLMPELLELERSWMDRNFYRSIEEKDLEHWLKQYESSLALLEDQGRQAWLGSRIAWLHYRKVAVQDPEMGNTIEQWLTAAPPEARSLHARLDNLKARSTWFFMTGKPQEAHRCNKDTLDLMEEHPFLVELEPKRYLVTLNNFLIDNHQLKRYDVLAEGLQKLKALPRRKEFQRLPQLEEKIFELSTLLELNAWVDRKRFAEALEHLPAIETGLGQHGEQIAFHYRLTFYYLIGYIYFVNRHYDTTLTWINPLLQQPPRNVVEEVLRFARWLNILTHFELGHFELVDSLLLAQRRQLSQQGSLYKAEQLLFKFLKKLINAASEGERSKLFRQLHQQLAAIGKDPAEQRVFIYFDFIGWLTTK